MMAALKPTCENSTAKELELAADFHRKEIELIKSQHQEHVRAMELDLKQQKDNLIVKESMIKELEKKMLTLEETLHEECGKKLEKLHEEYKKQINLLELDAHVRITNLSTAMEKTRLENLTLKKQNEKLSSNASIMESKTSLSRVETFRSKISADNDQSYIGEIKGIKAEFEEYKTKSNETILMLTKQRDNALTSHTISNAIF